MSRYIFNHSYDTLDRVTGANYTDVVVSPLVDENFVYDTLGNRITHDLEVGTDTVYSSNEVNEYTAIGGASVSHDDAGNFTADHCGYAYEYDYENRLTAITKDSGSTTVAAFAYDALGRRVESTGNIYGTYTFYYDGWRVLREERVASPTLTFNNEYVYGNYLDEVCMMNLRLNDAVQAYSYYFVHDHLYSTVAWLNSTSGIINRYEYNAYGQRKIMNADYTDAAYSFNHISFTGQRQDDLDGGNLKLMYYKNRYYDTEIGRFLTRDPSYYVDSMNLYQYVKSNPIKFFDPSGEKLLTYNCYILGIAGLAHGICFGDCLYYCNVSSATSFNYGLYKVSIYRFGYCPIYLRFYMNSKDGTTYSDDDLI